MDLESDMETAETGMLSKKTAVERAWVMVTEYQGLLGWIVVYGLFVWTFEYVRAALSGPPPQWLTDIGP